LKFIARKLIISITVKLLAFSEVMVKESNKFFKFLKSVKYFKLKYFTLLPFEKSKTLINNQFAYK